MPEEGVDTLVKAMVGIEAGRRVGWAKFYEEAEAHSKVRLMMFHRMGVLVGFVERAKRLPISKASIGKMVKDFAEVLMDEPGDREAYQLGLTDAPQVIEERWGQIRVSKIYPQQPEDEVQWPLRCPECKKLLAYQLTERIYSIGCQRCNYISLIGHKDA